MRAYDFLVERYRAKTEEELYAIEDRAKAIAEDGNTILQAVEDYCDCANQQRYHHALERAAAGDASALGLFVVDAVQFAARKS